MGPGASHIKKGGLTIIIKKSIIGFILVTAIVLSIIGCEPRRDGGGKVIAQINGKEIKEEEFKNRFSRLPISLKSRYTDEKGKKEFLDEIVKRELLLQEAKRVGIEKDQAILERIEDMRERLILNEFLQREIDHKLIIADKELEDYYNLHKDEFRSPDESRISHILLKSEKDAKEVLKRLRKGADFAKMAKEFSADVTTKDSGGEMGVIQRGKMHPELDPVIFGMNEGDISEPIKTETGYHIIKLLKKIPGTPLPFEDARNIVAQRYRLEKRSKAFEDLIAGLRSKARITISEENLKGTNVDDKPSQ